MAESFGEVWHRVCAVRTTYTTRGPHKSATLRQRLRPMAHAAVLSIRMYGHCANCIRYVCIATVRCCERVARVAGAMSESPVSVERIGVHLAVGTRLEYSHGRAVARARHTRRKRGYTGRSVGELYHSRTRFQEV
jgi:hypothetical protein